MKTALCLALCGGCASPEPEPIRAVDPAPPAPSASAAPAPSSTSDSASRPIPNPSLQALPFAEWMVSNCHVDELAPSAYTIAWFRYARPSDLLGPHDPVPAVALSKLPEPGSEQAKTRIQELTKDWLEHPRSHVVDCSFIIEPRECPGCKRGSVVRAHYVAYLPKALFEKPEMVEGMLFLIPGGNGGRTRPFMRPIPGHIVYDRGSGGLDTKRVADAFYDQRPHFKAMLIASLETGAGAYENGPAEHLSVDLPQHLQSIFLTHLGQKRAWLGAEGVSSGAGELYRAALKHPEAFNTLGFSCMSCTGIDPRVGRLGGRPVLLQFADQLSERRKRGEFQLRFAIGEYDGQISCNRALFKEFLERGAAKNDKNENEGEAFRIYPGEKHDFDFLRRSYRDSLEWHLNTLGEMASKRGLGEWPKEQKKAPP